jgi:hypothetical protein
VLGLIPSQKNSWLIFLGFSHYYKINVHCHSAVATSLLHITVPGNVNRCQSSFMGNLNYCWFVVVISSLESQEQLGELNVLTRYHPLK